MDVASSLVIDTIGPAVLLIILLGLALNPRFRRALRGRERTDEAERALNQGEEQSRRDRTDQL